MQLEARTTMERRAVGRDGARVPGNYKIPFKCVHSPLPPQRQCGFPPFFCRVSRNVETVSCSQTHWAFSSARRTAERMHSKVLLQRVLVTNIQLSSSKNTFLKLHICSLQRKQPAHCCCYVRRLGYECSIRSSLQRRRVV